MLIKGAGALYLLWLAVGMLRAAWRPAPAPAASTTPGAAAVTICLRARANP